MSTSDNTQLGLFIIHRKVINGLWYLRWWLLITAGLLAMIVVYSMPIKDHGVEAFTASGLLLRLKFAVLFNILAVQLTAWFLCFLKAIADAQLKWIAGLLLFPPTAFVYLIRHRC